MTLSASLLLDNDATEISASVYLPDGLEIDFTFNSRRFLKAGFIETDTGTYDTAIHQGSHAGSSTPSVQGDLVRYVRIT